MSTELALPSQFDVNLDGVGGVPYLVFFSPKSQKAAEYAAALPGIREPDPIIVMPSPENPIKLDQLQLFVVAARQAWVDSEDDGTINGVTFTQPDSFQSPYQEVIESVVLVWYGEVFIPVRASFRTTKCPGIKAVLKAIEKAGDPAWADHSAAHAAAMKVSMQWARVCGTITTQPRTGRQSGRKYFTTKAAVAPITSDQYRALAQCVAVDEWKKEFQAVNASYLRRLTELEGYVA